MLLLLLDVLVEDFPAACNELICSGVRTHSFLWARISWSEGSSPPISIDGTVTCEIVGGAGREGVK